MNKKEVRILAIVLAFAIAAYGMIYLWGNHRVEDTRKLWAVKVLSEADGELETLQYAEAENVKGLIRIVDSFKAYYSNPYLQSINIPLEEIKGRPYREACRYVQVEINKTINEIIDGV